MKEWYLGKKSQQWVGGGVRYKDIFGGQVMPEETIQFSGCKTATGWCQPASGNTNCSSEANSEQSFPWMLLDIQSTDLFELVIPYIQGK